MIDIATIPTRALQMPDGNEYEFFGKTYYGVCYTVANTNAKVVSINGFTSASLVEGVRVVVIFSYGNDSLNPTLNISNTGAISILSSLTTIANQYEWDAGIVSFIYDGLNWVMENSQHASTTYWGRTKLTNTISNDGTVALTPKAVYDSNFVSDSSYVHTDNNFTTSLKNKLDGIASGAEVNVQANWTQTTTTADDYIKNKPTTISGYGITDAYTKTEVDGKVAGVLHYKGTKATTSALPTSGNVTGDVWHVTADGSEWAWDGSTWQELGTAVDLSNYVLTTDSRLSDARTPTAHDQALSTITGADDLKAIESLTGTSGLLKKTAANTWTLDTSNYLTSYTETDPVFGASAAAGITSTDISNWNNKSDTDEKLRVVDASSDVLGFLIFGNGTTSQVRYYDSNNLKYESTLGTTSTVGTAKLTIGNNLSSTTDKNTRGKIILYGTGNNFVELQAIASGTNRTVTFPNNSGTVALTSDIPSKLSDLQNDAGYITGYTETDPTVPAWAKESTKPSYTASEVGAVPTSRTVNGKALSSNISLTASDVGALPDNTVITDEKLKTDTINSNNQYYPVLGNYTSNAETKYICPDFRFRKISDITEIQLGQVASGSTKNGRLVLCSGAYYTYLNPPLYSSISSNITYTLPSSTGTLALTSEIPLKTSDLQNDSGFITGYTETDPVFSASAAAGITSADISSWNAKVSDDKTWKNKGLSMTTSYEAAAVYIPQFLTTSASEANITKATSTPTDYAIAKYDYGGYLKSTTPSANDNSTKVATTAYVDAAIPKVYSSTNLNGYLTMATLPIYDGTVV